MREWLSIVVLSFSLASCSTVPRSKTAAWDRGWKSLAPATPTLADKELFARYSPRGPSAWADNWTRRLDFTGIAWDSPRGGTLIHPRFVIYASHFQRRVGETLVFHDRQGSPVVRRIVAKKTIHSIAQPDVTVAKLDRAVPSNVRVYPLLNASVSELAGAKLLVTDRNRRVHVFQISRVEDGLFEELIARPGFARHIHPAWSKRLARGDSGHPSFVVMKGQLTLASILRGGGWAYRGPFLGGAKVRQAVAQAMRDLG